MKHLSILVPDGEENNLSSIVGAYKIFTRANQFRKALGREEVFRVELAGISGEVTYHGGLFSVRPHTHISRIHRSDLVIVPSLNHNYEQALARNEPLLNWLREQQRQGAAIAGICTGAFLLAAAGLLNGRTCSTHWSAAEAFRSRFPETELKPDLLITDEQGIYTNGGAYSFLNLIVYLVEKYYDRETAIYCAKVFQIGMDRQSQSEFIIFKGQKQHNDDMVREAQNYIEGHLQERISVEALSAKFLAGRRNFDRRFLKATGNTPLEYAQRVKMEAAKKAFESSRKTISEVMYEVGYSDVKAFREVFRRITGMSPLEYRSRYNRGAAL
ncbi:MAG: GlxA family transcriptional regulator [Flavobacteriales bacterium]